MVLERVSHEPMLLSNWHVLAGRWAARTGGAICQPGTMDGGTAADTVARYTRHAMGSHLDAAVARLTGTARGWTNRQLGIGPVRGRAVPRQGLGVDS